jgi:hypothetical protein
MQRNLCQYRLIHHKETLGSFVVAYRSSAQPWWERVHERSQNISVAHSVSIAANIAVATSAHTATAGRVPRLPMPCTTTSSHAMVSGLVAVQVHFLTLLAEVNCMLPPHTEEH